MKKDILIKPLTIRIIRLLTNNELTVKEISGYITEISKPSLYRHIKKMYQENIIKVTNERIINGITEKTYTFAMGNGILSEEEFKEMSEKEYKMLFTQFISLITGDFDENFKNYDLNYLKYNTSFTQMMLYLSEDEENKLNKELKKVFNKYINNKPNKKRYKKVISFVSMPNK